MTLLVPKFLQGVGSDDLPAYSALSMRLLLGALWDEGILFGLNVTERAAGANFTVDVAAGQAYIAGDDFANQGNYQVESTTTENKIVPPAPGGGTRFDIVVARVNDQQAGGPSTDDLTIEVVEGTIDAGPPPVPSTALLLATIGPITPSTPAITTGLITDDRVWAGRKATPGTIEAVHHQRPVNGWLYCDGSVVNSSERPALADALGIIGPTFNLPDLRGRSLFGATDGATGNDRVLGITVGETGGERQHILTTGEMPQHNHGGGGNTGGNGSHNHGGTQVAGNHSHSMQSAGSHQHGSGGLSGAVNTQVARPGAGTVAGGSGTVFASILSVDISGNTASSGGHTHPINAVGNHSHGIATVGNHSHPYNIPQAGSSQGHNNVPPHGTSRWLIRA